MQNASSFPPPPPEPPPGVDSSPSEALSVGMPLPIGQVVSDAFGMYFRNFFKYSGIVTVVLLPLIFWTVYLHLHADSFMVSPEAGLLGDSMFMDDDAIQRVILITLVTFGLSFLFQPLATGAIIFAVFRAKKGEDAGFGRALGVAFGRILPLIGVAIVSGLILVLGAGVPAFIGAVMIGLGGFGALLGLAALVAALVILLRLSCSLYVASPAVVVEREGVGTAIRRSFSLSRGSRWRIFGVMALVGVVNWIVDQIIEVVAEDGPGLGLGMELASMVAFGAIAAVASASCYYYLKVREGADVDELASVFD